MKDYTGMKWKELSEKEKERLLKDAHAVDGVTCEFMMEDGECIIDLSSTLSVSGEIRDGEIFIDDEAVIYNPEDGIKVE